MPLFETVTIDEELPKVLVIGQFGVARALVDRLRQESFQVYWLQKKSLPLENEGVFVSNPEKIEHLPDDFSFVFWEEDEDEDAELAKKIAGKLEKAWVLHFNPKTYHAGTAMFVCPFVFGPDLKGKNFGFLAYVQEEIIRCQRLVWPKEKDLLVRPVFVDKLAQSLLTFFFEPARDQIFWLLGKEEISFAQWAEKLLQGLKIEPKTFTSQIELRLTPPESAQKINVESELEKDLALTIDFINQHILAKIDNVEIIYTEVFPDLPKHIPAISELPLPENFELTDKKIKKIYHENLTYLKKEALILPKKSVIQDIKKKERRFSFRLLEWKKHLRQKMRQKIKRVSFLLWYKPKILFYQFVKKFGRLVQVAGLLFVILGLPLIVYPLIFAYSIFNLQLAKTNLLKARFDQTAFHLSQSEFSRSATFWLTTKVMPSYFRLLHQEQSLANMKDFLDMEKKILKIANEGLIFGKSAGKLLSAIAGEGNEDFFRVYDEVKNSFSEIKTQSRALVADLKNSVPSPPLFLKFKSQEYYAMFKKLPKMYDQLKVADITLASLPAILGQDERKVYVVLLQNNMELRSTGGFIGSFALISFEKGKMLDFQVQDVYTADGQLKGRVEPPPEILHYLGQPNWYLRDSNVDPDFPTSAKMAAWFLEKELKVKVDGVVAIDINFIQKLLDLTGPVVLADFKETVTAQTLFEKTEKIVEKNFFPGSTKKKDFLTSLSKNLYQKIFSLDGEKGWRGLNVLWDSIASRSLQVFFFDEKLQTFAQDLKMDGALTGGKNQFLSLIENNYGANKANFFIKRQIKHNVSLLAESVAQHELTVEYENLSPSNLWPTGEYQAYLKFYIPSSSEFLDLSLDQKKPKLSDFLNEYTLTEIEKDEQLVLRGETKDLNYYGVYFKLPVKKKKQLVFRWQTPLSTAGVFDFNFHRQAGTFNDNYNLLVHYPSDRKAESSLTPSLASPGLFQYNLTSAQDFELVIKY